MEAQHVPNPWQQRQQSKHNLCSVDPPDSSFTLTSEKTVSADDFFQDHKQVFYKSQQLLQHLQQQQQEQQQQRKQHQHLKLNGDHANGDETENDGDEEGETDSQGTAWSRLGMDSPLNQSSSTLADSTTVLFMADSGYGAPEDDVLESLVETLQSEVKDTRATVHELEGRLNSAEHSNWHLVEELKMLLADAEVTLRNAGNINGNSSSESLSSFFGRSTTGESEDSNIVYNRICDALQALIDEAQLALQKNSSAKQSFADPGNGTHGTLASTLTGEGLIVHSTITSSEFPPSESLLAVEEQQHDLASRRSARNSLTLLNPIKTHSQDDGVDLHRLATIASTAIYSPTSIYSSTDEVSRIYWRQKHEEQHDRYRKSCHRLTLELEGRFQTDSEDSEASFNMSRRPKVRASPSATPSGQSTAPSTPTTPTQPLQGILRSSMKDGLKRERLKKKYQVQFLNANIEGSSRQDAGSSTALYHLQQHGQEQQQQHQEQQPRQLQRQYTSRSVGSTRSRGVLLQLYELWQQTWLRTRIMHVITGSVEIVIIIWVVIKASRLTLTWFGIQPSNFNQWITFIYGHRDSAGVGAKELYAKIRKDGLQLRQVKAWSRREPEALVEDLVAGVAASTSLISPSKIVYGPAKRVIVHAVTGVALAFLSGGARRLVRKL